MYTKEELEEKWSNIKFESSFEPTLNPFKNGLLVNYKKVGTRYMGQLLSLPLDIKDSKIQMDLIIKKQPIRLNNNLLNSEQYIIKYENDIKFCYTDFDKTYDNIENSYKEKYIEYTSSLEFLKYCEVNNYNELFFNNKKDIIFLIRNPIHRFFSGIIQVLYIILIDIDSNKELAEEIKFYTKLDVDELKYIYKLISNYWNINEEELSTLKKNELELLFSFIIEKQWNKLFQDIHTQNYLFNYIEWIYNIKDKSKIKIIDLKDCRTNKSFDFFSSLIGNDILGSYRINSTPPKTNWEFMGDETGSNKKIYNLFYSKFINSGNKLQHSSIYYYLKDEYEIYDSLINSPYFVDLKD
jgi:hypothetical protein